MLIEVQSQGPLQELCIIELQGELQHDDQLQGDLKLGTLSAHSSSADTLYLQVGYHRLEGKKVLLKKPLAVLRRMEGRQASSDGGEGPLRTQAPTGYVVHGYITSKYLFNKRPKALITNPNRA
jgi:chromosome transmission fidelity protein 8